MQDSRSELPLARAEGLLHRALPDGDLMVYDTHRHRAHSLNRTAALIWQQCDGRTSVAQMAAGLRQLGLPADEELVWLALARLEKAHLVRERSSVVPLALSRRAVIRKLGLVGGLAALVPVVDSITSPAPARAASVACLPKASPCTPNGPPCCSGVCIPGLREAFICC